MFIVVPTARQPISLVPAPLWSAREGSRYTALYSLTYDMDEFSIWPVSTEKVEDVVGSLWSRSSNPIFISEDRFEDRDRPSTPSVSMTSLLVSVRRSSSYIRLRTWTSVSGSEAEHRVTGDVFKRWREYCLFFWKRQLFCHRTNLLICLFN